MIVRTDSDGLQLITQPDHAALARRIMERWQSGSAFVPGARHGAAGTLPPPSRQASVFHAIGAHDDGWIELDNPLVIDASGQIADFMTAPAPARRAVWPRAVAKLASDPWAAALVAQHAIHIYAHAREDAEWTAFFTEMEQQRTAWLQVAGGPLETLLEDYRLVRLGDLLSLTFCNRWSDRRDALGYGMYCDGPRVVVTPDPFSGEVIPIAIAARTLPNRRFTDAADAAAAWRDARVVTLTGTIAGKT